MLKNSKFNKKKYLFGCAIYFMLYKVENLLQFVMKLKLFLLFGYSYENFLDWCN